MDSAIVEMEFVSLFFGPDLFLPCHRADASFRCCDEIPECHRFWRPKAVFRLLRVPASRSIRSGTAIPTRSSPRCYTEENIEHSLLSRYNTF
jgi:hypothetical protein